MNIYVFVLTLLNFTQLNQKNTLINIIKFAEKIIPTIDKNQNLLLYSWKSNMEKLFLLICLTLVWGLIKKYIYATWWNLNTQQNKIILKF